MANTKAAPRTTSTEEYQVWYDATDGVRRSANALDMAGVQQTIADLNADEDRRQQLASGVGLTIAEHVYNFTVLKVTTTTEEVTT